MSITVDVHLLSGRCASMQLEANSSIESLKRRAQTALASRGRLVTSSGEVLDGAQTVTEAKLRSGDVLTLHVNQVQLKVTQDSRMDCSGMGPSAFAAILCDGSVVTWGPADYGGDSSAVQEQLRECAADPSFSPGIRRNPE